VPASRARATRRLAVTVLTAPLLLVACAPDGSGRASDAGPEGVGPTSTPASADGTSAVPAPTSSIEPGPGATGVGSTDPSASSTAPADAASEATAPDESRPTDSSAEDHAAPATTVNVYAATDVGGESPNVANARHYVYVPSNGAGTVTVIDQETRTVVDEYRVGKLTQHVVPAWDLTVLFATASGANQLVPIDPTTGKPGPPIRVDAPYNLYFAPDGSAAIVMAERLDRIDFYDRFTWKRFHSIPTGACKGVNHADWSPDLSFFIATCEFSGDVVKVDSATLQIVNTLPLPDDAMPQDLRLAPDGSKFYVADMHAGGAWILDGTGTAITGFIPTGVGAHGIYPSRDGRYVYITNRGRMQGDTGRASREGDGSVSVVDPATDAVIARWPVPGGGSPDMGGVSADGTTFWVSGRYDDEVYAFDTATGAIVAQIPVPEGPHGLAVFPQPGQYSLGHTGNYR
jgi:DNA-binding beta-propeller fold protein YncE